MIIIVGYTPTPEGEAALDHAIAEAHHHDDDLLVVNVSASSNPHADFATDTQVADLERRLRAEGVRFTLRQLVRGRSAADEILDLEADQHVRGVVIGLRHRSPVGKLLLGSTAQRILLESTSPVISVKAVR
ncbi:universal stress protein [Isoptericola sp. b441]|uniref:Universal stress protein n=1 Tax=Actinotalea lenta TaxID=3064654 RepID=A0ABT9D619_9CELL|nr:MULTISPECIES: universal stress protein [unclassified Isoptericola]MDO8105940.1 universal stress protein [Isoptericola sp. b441]MDO8122655.1 universal stress protein [Isoptericola sp. b490]